MPVSGTYKKNKEKRALRKKASAEAGRRHIAKQKRKKPTAKKEVTMVNVPIESGATKRVSGRITPHKKKKKNGFAIVKIK